MDHDSITAEAPLLMRRIMPLVFLGGLVSAWYLWNKAMSGAPVSWNGWLLTAIAILCGPLWFFNGTRRVVMDRGSVSEFRGGRLLRRYPIRDLTALRSESNAVRLTFAGRGAITIPTAWTGAGDILHRLKSVADLRAGGAPPTDDWLPLNDLTFPTRCVGCGNRDAVVHPIFAGVRYYVPGAHIVRGCQIPVPACRRCSRRRNVVGFVAAFALIALGIGLNAAAALASERVLFVIAFLMLLVIIHLVSNQVPRWLDQRLLGVAALRLGNDKTSVRLWFRDRQEEIEVRTLTAESRTLHLASAAEALRASGT